MQQASSISTILQTDDEDIIIKDGEQGYLHSDLDSIWIKGRIKKHFEKHTIHNTQEEKLIEEPIIENQ